MKIFFGQTMLAATILAPSMWAATNEAPGVTVSMLVTVESKQTQSEPVSKNSFRVQERKQDRPVSEVTRVEAGKLQMLLLIDDSAGSAFDTQIQELKKFIKALPSNTEVGVGYMHNGIAQMASGFTSDHEKAAESIRLAEGLGGADVSPYDSLSDAVKKWPVNDGRTRREVVMISSGLEGLGGGMPPENPYVNAGIRDAQMAGVVVYAIYNPSSGHAGHSLWQSSWGQNLLSQVTDETGGELYSVGFGAAVSFDPYLTDILKRQSEQYVVTFEASAEKKSGLQQVKISSTEKGISVAAPDKVFVKASL